MAFEIPESTDGLVYFTRRKFADDKGHVIAWVGKARCGKCKKGMMGKPHDPKTKKVLMRAKEYVCDACGNAELKAAHEATLSVSIIYTCPFCAHKDEQTVPFARKSWYGKKAICFACAKCKEKLGITKRLSTPADFVAKLQGKPVSKKAAKEEVDVDGDDDDF
jgi:superfamily II helicase